VAQFGYTHCRWVLITVTVSDALPRYFGDLGRSISIWESLAEVDGLGSPGEIGHLGEDTPGMLAHPRDQW